MPSRLKFASLATVTLLSLTFPLFPIPESIFPVQAQTTQDRKASAERLFQEGRKLLSQRQYQAALEKLQQALRIYQDIGDRSTQGAVLYSIGDVYYYQDQHARSLEFYQQALVILKETGNRLGEATTLNDIGMIYANQRQHAKALEYYQQALAVRRDIGDRAGEGTTLTNIGSSYSKLDQHLQALEYYQQALTVRRDIGDRAGEGTVLNNIGGIYNSLGQYSKALEVYQQALAILKDIGARTGEGIILNNIGSIHDQLSQYPQALEYYQQALAVHKDLGNRSGEGTTLNNIGGVYEKLGQYPQGLEYFQQALSILKDMGDRAGEGTILNNIGGIYSSLGQHRRALEYYQQALAIRKDMGNHSGQGNTLNNIGFAYSSLGQYPQALEYYQQALSILKNNGNRLGEGTTLNNIGGIYSSLGQYRKALEYYQQALAIRKDIGDRSGEGQALNNIGLIYSSLGEYPQALKDHQQALFILKNIGDRAGEAQSLNNIGGIYSNLGQYSKALEYYQQASAIRKDIGDRSGEAQSLNNIGFIHFSLGQYPQALEYYQQALAILKDIGDRSGEGITLNNIGMVHSRLKQYPQALEYYQQALAIQKDIGDRSGESTSLNNIGFIYSNLKQYPQALEYYQQALAIRKDIGNRSGQGNTLNNIGHLLEAQQQPELAIVFLKQSVSTYEAIREELRVLPKEQQQSYTETVASTYRRLADILLQQDRILEAQQVLDLLKLQELEDYLRNVRGGQQALIVLRPEEEILKQYSELQKTAIQLGQELAQLRKIAKTNRTEAQQQRIAQLVELEESINQKFKGFIEEPTIQAKLAELRRVAPGETISTESFNRLRNNLQKLGNAVLLYPLILDDRLELVITTPNTPPLRRTVQVKREELNRAIAQYRSALKSRSSDVKVHAQTLYNWLIKPLENDLKQANAETIIYAPDGQLRYIPLAALHDGNQWLVQRLRFNNITAASLDELNPQPPVPLDILAGAFANQQLQYEFPTALKPMFFKGLPFAGREVENLVAAIPGTHQLIDQDFSLNAIKPLMNDYAIVHFATHAAFLPGEPKESFIVFGDGSRATLDAIASWSLTNVALVVLSACETGLALDGQGNSAQQDGREVLGLGYQFQLAGAKATIASLWQVDDGGTQTLMNAFYAALQQGMTKTQALQAAQNALITGDYTTVGGKRSDIEIVDSRTGQPQTVSIDTLQHPYYWAPFILIGNGL